MFVYSEYVVRRVRWKGEGLTDESARWEVAIRVWEVEGGGGGGLAQVKQQPYIEDKQVQTVHFVQAESTVDWYKSELAGRVQTLDAVDVKALHTNNERKSFFFTICHCPSTRSGLDKASAALVSTESRHI